MPICFLRNGSYDTWRYSPVSRQRNYTSNTWMAVNVMLGPMPEQVPTFLFQSSLDFGRVGFH